MMNTMPGLNSYPRKTKDLNQVYLSQDIFFLANFITGEFHRVQVILNELSTL
jgi:hypothetical protein